MKKILILFILALTLSLTSCNLEDLGNLEGLIPGGTIIGGNQEEQEQIARLKNVMPDAKGFEELYSASNHYETTLPVRPQSFEFEGDLYEGVGGVIISIHRETSGLGYVFRFGISTKFSRSQNDYTVGVTTDGVICGIHEDAYTDSKSLTNDFYDSFIGQGTSLSGVELVSGATHSSAAVKEAIRQSMMLLVQNGLISANQNVSDHEILRSLISNVFSGFVVGRRLEVSGNIVFACVSENESGMMYILDAGDEYYLVVFNNMKRYKVFGLNDNKTELVEKIGYDSDVVNEAVSHALNNVIYEEVRNIAVAQFKKMMGTEDVVISPNSTEVFNTVCAHVEINVDGQMYQGYYSRTPGFKDMDIFVVIDSEGKICQVKAKTLIFNEEYFMGFNGVPSDYYQNMIGLNQYDDIDGLTIITGATYTSNAMATAIKDAFEAYNNVRVR